MQEFLKGGALSIDRLTEGRERESALVVKAYYFCDYATSIF